MPTAASAETVHRESAVRIACVPMAPVIGEREQNVERGLAFIAEAAGAGARLIYAGTALRGWRAS